MGHNPIGVTKKAFDRTHQQRLHRDPSTMVVKKRLGSSLERDEEFILPFTNEDCTDMKGSRVQTRALHESLDESAAYRCWNAFGRNKRNDLVLPTFTTHCNPQTADLYFPASEKSTILFTTRKRKATWVTLIVCGLAFCGIAAHISLKESAMSILGQITGIAENHKTLLMKVHGAEKDVRVLEREAASLESASNRRRLQESEPQEHLVNHSSVLEKIEKVKASIQERRENAQNLRHRVQELSRHEALQKYGPGPHRVKIELDFGSDQPGGSFVAELASLDLMPHSVNCFLNMVSEGLWDGNSFVMNAVHMVKASPLPAIRNTSTAHNLGAFDKDGLSHLAFAEYSEEFTHMQYTLGFSGGDSPSWYINTEDNTDFHRGDPCFGKIIDGFTAVQRLQSRPTKDGIWYTERVGIKHAMIL